MDILRVLIIAHSGFDNSYLLMDQILWPFHGVTDVTCFSVSPNWTPMKLEQVHIQFF
jgi:hypothetical protein